jgi:electron transfer flavoprotein beta subunit
VKILVCIKQVPDTEDVKTDPVTGNLIRDGLAATINPFDMYAIEESLNLKENYGGEVTVLSMGPPAAEHSLRYVLALGADNAVLLSDRAFAGADTLATSYSIAQGIRKIGGADVIFTGSKTVDGDTGQVGAGIAEFLDCPVVYYVTEVKAFEKGSIVVERLLEDRVQVLRVKTPCVLSVVNGINKPRLPTMRQKIESERKEITVLDSKGVDADPKHIGLDGSPTKVVKMFPPEKRKKGKILKGRPEKVAKEFVDYLEKMKVIE